MRTNRAIISPPYAKPGGPSASTTPAHVKKSIAQHCCSPELNSRFPAASAAQSRPLPRPPCDYESRLQVKRVSRVTSTYFGQGKALWYLGSTHLWYSGVLAPGHRSSTVTLLSVQATISLGSGALDGGHPVPHKAVRTARTARDGGKADRHPAALRTHGAGEQISVHFADFMDGNVPSSSSPGCLNCTTSG